MGSAADRVALLDWMGLANVALVDWMGLANVALVDWLVAVSVAGVAWIGLYRWMQRGHKGPKSWPLMGCMVEQARNFDTLHDWLLHYFRQLATFSVPMMSINNTFTVDPLNVEHILKTNFNNYPKGELIHERFVDVMGHGIFNVDGEKWVRQRKVAVLEFSSSKLRDHSSNAFRTKALKLVHVLNLAARANQPVDLQDLFMRLTLDSICEVGFGIDPESLSPELPAVPFANAFDEANRLVIRRYVDFLWKVKRALNIGAEARLRKCVQVIDGFLYGVINARRAELKDVQPNTAERADLLSRFMTLPNEEGVPYTDKHLRDVVINFIIAGRDTTALTLSWLFSMLCQHPRVVQNILEEAKSVLADPAIKPTVNGHGNTETRNESHGSTNVDLDNCDVAQFAQLLTYQALNKMTYLHASITEALRLYPAVPLESKIAVSDDVFPDGTEVKAGNFVSYSPYAMGRLEYIWGPDVMEFKPERWLKDGVFQPQSPFKLTAFQAGPRMCLGKDSAYLQMKMTTVMLLKFFSFKLVDDHPLKYSMMVVLYMAHGLKTIVSAR